MRTFYLHRKEDATGISGTGKVAEGVEFANGWCALNWLTAHTSMGVYPSIAELEAIHGHGGRTEVVFEERWLIERRKGTPRPVAAEEPPEVIREC